MSGLVSGRGGDGDQAGLAVVQAGGLPGWGSATANLLATQSMAPRAASLFSCSGVLERHPGLHIVMIEVNGGWLAWVMHTLGGNTAEIFGFDAEVVTTAP